MIDRLSLRFRVFLFFAFLVCVEIAAVAAPLIGVYYYGDDINRLIQFGAGAIFVMSLCVMWAWVMFDENMVRPIERIARDARAAAFGKASTVRTDSARYLGLLAPAARDVVGALTEARAETDEAVRHAVAEAARRRRQLETILRDLDQGMLICTLDHKILLYNRKAIEILHVTGEIGLGRSLFTLVTAQPFRHALDRLTNRFKDGRHRSHPDGLGALVVCATADGGRTLQGRVSLMLDEGETAPAGYVVSFEDVTTELAELVKRDRMLRHAAEAMRRPITNLRAAVEMLADPTMDAESRQAFEAVLAKESTALAAALDRFDRERRDVSAQAWPMSDMFSNTVWTAVIRRRTGPQNFTAEIVGQPVWVHCDSVTVVELLDVLMNKIAGHAPTRTFSLTATPKNGKTYLDMSWPGPIVPMTVLESWLHEPLDPSVGGVTGREVLERHETDFWCEADGEGRARLRLPLSGPRQAHRGRAPVIDARPEFYDFDLLGRIDPERIDDTPLRNLDYVVFDTETTGLEPSKGDRMISLAGVRIVNGRVLRGEVFATHINPRMRIPPASTRIHKITDAMVTDAPHIEEVLPRFRAFAADSVLIAHNAAFDMRFLTLQQEACKVRFDNPVLDTVLLAAHLDGQADSLTLDTLADRFAIEIPPEDRHTALGDSLATAELFLRLVDMLEVAGVRTLREAVAASTTAGAIRRKQAAY
ncbi:MAG: PAS domain-containing protein [Rhodobacteraceae bacterium]|nr:MAG: PAS domain-containing protein [Paracoccaceae bacterium]